MPPSNARDDGIRHVVEACQARWAAGEDVYLPAITARHPQWMPQLAVALEQAQRIEQARRAAQADRREGPTVAHTGAATPPISAMDSLPRHIGDYSIEELIGAGGMGVVCRARQRSLERSVAIKLLRDQVTANEAMIQRFRSEALMASRLDHPNIVTIYEFGQSDGRYFLAMQYVAGRNLGQMVTEATLDERASASILQKAAAAMHYAHQQGVLHRDLKPSNVIIDAQGEPRITDFGLAKQLEVDSGLTHSGDVIGTPDYMPPEQALGQSVDVRSDVYALGAILYELSTGRPPFRAATMRQVIDDSVVEPRKLNSAVARDWETVCLKCLEKDPHRRYQSAAELAEELGRFLRGEPVRAKRPSPWGRAQRWCRREPKLATALAVAAALVLMVLVASPWIASRERTLRKQADTAASRARTAERSRQSAQAETALQAAMVARRRWQWGEMNRLLDQAMALNPEDPLQPWIHKLDALDGLGDLSTLQAVIRRVERSQDLDGYQSQVLWRKADLARQLGDHQQKKRLASAALELGIQGADASYVRAMLADNTPDLIQHLQKCLAIDPLHHRARPQLVTMYALTGKLQQAHDEALMLTLLAPHDPRHRMELAILAKLQGNEQVYQESFDRLQSQVSPQELQLVQDVAELFPELSQLASLHLQPRTLPGMLLRGMEMLPRLAAVQQRFSAPESAPANNEGPTIHSLVSLFRSLPPHILESYQIALDRLMAQLRIGLGDSAQQRDDAIDALAQAAAAHPDGLLHLYRASLLVHAQRWSEAEAAAVAAAETFSLFSEVRRNALSLAAMMAGVQFLLEGQPQQHLDRTVELTRRRLELGPFESPQIAVTVVSVIAEGGQFDLALQVLRGLDQETGEDPMLQARWAQAAWKTGSLAEAIRRSDQVHSKWPDHSPAIALARTVRGKAQEELRALLAPDHP